MKKIIVHDFLILLTGGIVYFYFEIFVRGFSHISMFILGGMCFLLVGKIGNKILQNDNEILILDKKGKDVTSKVTEISAFQVTIQYSADRIYTYNKSNLKIITSPIDLNDCLIVKMSVS